MDSDLPYRYTAKLAQQIELKWQKRWEEEGDFYAANVEGDLTDGQGRHADGRVPFFAIDMFPFPSGKGLHVGHPLGYIATDMVSRYHRMKGENVLHAMGFDAFGLPAEQYAVQTGQHPRITTENNIENMRRQLHRMGLSFDPRRSFSTTDKNYIRWTQWIFSQLYEAWYDPHKVRRDGGIGSARPISELRQAFSSGEMKYPEHYVSDEKYASISWDKLPLKEQENILNHYRLAYISTSPVNWCPGLGTVLANEEVTADGRSERGNYPVFKRELSQWSMRITDYASRLEDDLATVDWPEKVVAMQRHWIGRSTGALVEFPLVDSSMNQSALESKDGAKPHSLTVYTTRPDTIFGVSFLVISPQHPLVKYIPQEYDFKEYASDHRDSSIPSQWTGGSNKPKEAVDKYLASIAQRSTAQRDNDHLEKTGVFTGIYAAHPITGEKLPIFISDYVLMEYGTGAIMAVPDGDERDYDFAQSFDLPIKRIMQDAGSDSVSADKDSADKNSEDKASKNKNSEDKNSKNKASEDGATKEDDIAAESRNTLLTLINSCDKNPINGNKSLDLNGLHSDEAAQKALQWLIDSRCGKQQISFRLRDWLFSRQRYWGEPFPIVYDEEEIPHLIPEHLLPVELPDMPNFEPVVFDPDDSQSNPQTPLSRNQGWVEVELDLGDGLKKYHRETNTMPNWAGSSWYYLRYLNPYDNSFVANPVEEKYWMGPHHNKAAGESGGVDLYIGGVEHAVLHLLYARFWHKVLYDLGFVSSSEPFHKLFNQGYIQAYAYTDSRGQYVPASEVQENADKTYSWNGQTVQREFGKMGKSLKNIVTPDDMYESYGADTFRLYEMSMGPLAESRPWNTKDITGSQRFLQRLWRNVIDENTGEVTVTEHEASEDIRKLLHRTIAEVTDEMDGMRPNTAIAKLIVLNNTLTALQAVPREVIEPLIIMTSPMAPHICEELWSKLGHKTSLSHHPWPQADTRYLGVEEVTAVIQIKGKVRAKIQVPADISAQELEKRALAVEGIEQWLNNKPPRKIIVRPPKIVSLVPQD